MALPQSLRTSVTPPELELIASEQLIDIVPLVTMEKTAFVSVSTRFDPIYRYSLRSLVFPVLIRKGRPRSVGSSSEGSGSVMDSGESGLCFMEINEIRPFFVKGMSALTKLIRDPEHPPNLDET